MTREEASKMAKAALECMEREVSGCDEMCNSHKCDECALNYEKGNMGEQKEWLRLVIEALEQEPRWIPVSERLPEKGKEVLIYIDLFPYLATYEDGEWNTDNFTVDLEYEPTAWVELPEPYEPIEEGGRHHERI